jgi:hypothetical protein
MVCIDLVVDEAVNSFQLNIAVFDEVQELSEKKLLAPTLVSSEITVPQPIEVEQKQQTKSSLAVPIVTSILVGVAAVAAAALVYKKVLQKA